MSDVLNALSATRWITNLTPNAHVSLSQSGRVVSFRPGRRIIRAGENLREVMFLTSGTVRVGAPVIERGTTLAALRGPGAVLGAGEALSGSNPRTETVALETTTLVAIPMELFLKWAETEHRFALELGVSCPASRVSSRPRRPCSRRCRWPCGCASCSVATRARAAPSPKAACGCVPS